MKRLFLILLITLTILHISCATHITGENTNSTEEKPAVAPEESPDITQKPDISTPNTPSDTLPPESENTPTEEEVNPENDYALYVCSTVEGLRIREGKSASHKVLGYLDKGDMMLLVAEDGEYYKTIYRESTAYVHKNYCKVTKIPRASKDVEDALLLGAKMLGYPYVWGSQRYHWGNGVLNTAFIAGEFDCSAFVQYIFYHANGVILDVTSRKQSLNGNAVNDGLQRGDLMFFTNEARKNKTGTERIGHVGIYLGENYILHTASDHSVIEPISPTRWSYLITLRRVV